MAELKPFENRDVLGVGMEIPNAGGGLHEPLDVSPQEFHVGDETMVVMRLRVRKVRFDPISKTDGLRRVHVMEVDSAAFIDDAAAEKALAETKARIDEAHGTPQLDIPS